MGGGSKAFIYLVNTYIRPFPGCRILDIGCGSASLLSYLPGDVVYYGFDPNAAYIETAKKRYGNKGHFHCGLVESDTENLLYGMEFDIVIAHGVLHHLDDAQAAVLFAVAAQYLQPKGRLFCVDACFIPRQNPIARLIIRQDRGKNVRSPESYIALARQNFSSINGKIQHKIFIPYTHWIMECEK